MRVLLAVQEQPPYQWGTVIDNPLSPFSKGEYCLLTTAIDSDSDPD